MNCYHYSGAGTQGGLTIQQWLITIGFGVVSLFISVLLKFINEDLLCP